MTGFGRSHGDWQSHRITVELSSVNSKFLDLSYHGPQGMACLEVEARKLLSRQLQRGKVRCTVRETGLDGSSAPIALHENTLREYLRLYAEIKERFGLEGNLTAETLLFAEGIVTPAEVPIEDPQFVAWFEKLLKKGLDELLHMRTEEGTWLRKELETRLRTMVDLTSRILDRAPSAKDTFRERLIERLAECRDQLAYPEDRILTEAALLAERSDITEELTRLGSHIQQFRDSLEDGGPVGRRLDFLAQELNREINTIGSKTGDAEISKLVVYFKEELAKAREQAQNIE
jgi:uncharacterized protein (TIGR00255 family)